MIINNYREKTALKPTMGANIREKLSWQTH